MKRPNPSLTGSLSTLAVLLAVAVVLSVVAIGRDDGSGDASVVGSEAAGDVLGADVTDAVAEEGVGDGAGPAGTADSATAASGGPGVGDGKATTRGAGTPAAGAAGAQCAAGKNGGATDVGVTGSSVKLASTAVLDGPGSSFLGPVRIAMNAVVKKVNSTGGICGRRLELTVRNDSWDASTGQQFIRNFVEGEKVFALAVVPSSEGLLAADSYIKEQGVPVVGTDGMLVHQYENPWIWPVATPTISTMHVMAKDAHDRLKQDPLHAASVSEFGIVFDAKYHFGIEGAYAFDKAVHRLTGKHIDGFDPARPQESLKSCNKRFCGITPNLPSYSSQANDFNQACGITSGANEASTRCGFVAMLLEPDTAITWFKAGRHADPGVGFGGAQPLFNRNFAQGCAQSCDNMQVWTGYNPPIEALAGEPGVGTYVNDVKAESSSVDLTNQFVQGGYYGMRLLVQALQDVGPRLTRDALRNRLDSMTFDIGLSRPLTWQRGNHYANGAARAFSIRYQGGFQGFRQVTDFIVDPWLGQDGTIEKS